MWTSSLDYLCFQRHFYALKAVSLMYYMHWHRGNQNEVSVWFRVAMENILMFQFNSLYLCVLIHTYFSRFLVWWMCFNWLWRCNNSNSKQSQQAKKKNTHFNFILQLCKGKHFKRAAHIFLHSNLLWCFWYVYWCYSSFDSLPSLVGIYNFLGVGSLGHNLITSN